jgi:hypothetical protein
MKHTARPNSSGNFVGANPRAARQGHESAGDFTPETQWLTG